MFACAAFSRGTTVLAMSSSPISSNTSCAATENGVAGNLPPVLQIAAQATLAILLPLPGFPANRVIIPYGILSCHNHVTCIGSISSALRRTAMGFVCVARSRNSVTRFLNFPTSLPHSLFKTSLASLRLLGHSRRYVFSGICFCNLSIALFPVPSVSPARNRRRAIFKRLHSSSVGLYPPMGYPTDTSPACARTRVSGSPSQIHTSSVEVTACRLYRTVAVSCARRIPEILTPLTVSFFL